MDKVCVEGLRCWAHVGVPAAERARKQRVVLDLEIGLDLERAGRQDRVDATVDYAQLCAQVKRWVELKRFRLVEAMAHSVARRVLERFGPEEVCVRVRKFSVPGTESVGVELTRGKWQTTKRSPKAGPRSRGSARPSRDRR